MKLFKSFYTLLISSVFLFSCTDEDTFKTDFAEFEDLELEDQSYWNGSDGSGQFVYGNKVFNNSYYPDWNSWSGFGYSNVISSFYYDEIGKYAAFPSGGANESEYYVVGHQFEKMIITYTELEEPRLVQLTNSTYTALAIKYGYGYAKKFGGRDGSDPDWFKLTITGIGHAYAITGTVEFFLADYRFEDDEEDYIVDSWEYVDLTELGIVKSLEFELSSSDAGTPLYFCLDNLKGRVHY
ncbi:DUF4465 domain-containing protein [Bacteroidota bacterium]